MGHSSNQGITTTNKGLGINIAVITDLTEDACTVSEDLNSGLVESVANGSTGVYTVQLAAPYPAKLFVLPTLSNADGTTDLRFAAYETDSYDSDEGTFVINIMNDDDATAPVLADPGSTDELLLVIFTGRYTTI